MSEPKEETKKTVAKAPQPKESVYDAKELAANYKAFNTSYAIVDVALRLAGKDKYTLTEAKKIVDNFKNKEVK